MTDSYSQKPSKWFWIISVIALLWNAVGVFQYLIKAYNTEGFRSQYTAEQLEIIANSPAWATAAFAIGVFGGLIASGFLLMRRKLATIFYVFSLTGIIIQVYHNHFVIDSSEIMGNSAAYFSGTIVVIALLLLYFSIFATKKQWIR